MLEDKRSLKDLEDAPHPWDASTKGSIGSPIEVDSVQDLTAFQKFTGFLTRYGIETHGCVQAKHPVSFLLTITGHLY
ncbi:hypothetical protein EWM64_g8445 [Hericium alpestre]|uniref:Uncharacterized protein n=1 Tax=Hericium alpestre TaxID=135208 RepID=A0A4Y9ZQ07_9AGAM|nr:hypothetical protein EWM64_g8445 [Hericium alpestre]